MYLPSPNVFRIRQKAQGWWGIPLSPAPKRRLSRSLKLSAIVLVADLNGGSTMIYMDAWSFDFVVAPWP